MAGWIFGGGSPYPSQDRVQVQKLAMIYKFTPEIILGHLVVLAAVTILTWQDTTAPFLLIWAGCLVSIAGLRSLSAYGFHRQIPFRAEQHAAWGLIAASGATVMGVAWGLRFSYLLNIVGPVEQAFIIVVAASLVTIGGYALAVWLPAFIGASTGIALPISVSLWQNAPDSAGAWWSGLTLFYWLSSIAFTRGIGNRIEQSIALQFDNLDLVEELRKAQSEAENANRAKSELVAHVSHELNTPLNAILGFSEIIKDEHLGPVLPSKYRGYAEDIYKSGSHLLGLIRDLLDLSRIQTGRLDLQDEETSLKTIVQESVRLVEGTLVAAGLTLSVNLPEGKGPTVVIDPLRIKQVLVNILTNAVKYTPSGGFVTVTMLDVSDSGCGVSVEDNGVGIPPDQIERATEAYQRINAEHKTAQGAGLGLALTKGLMELHNGLLNIVSAPSKGTTVSVTLPRERVVTEPQMR